MVAAAAIPHVRIVRVDTKHRDVCFLALSGRCTVTALTTAPSQELTFVGRIDRGFDLLGCHFRPGELSVTNKTIEKFVARAIRLYEQEPGEPRASARLESYVRR